MKENQITPKNRQEVREWFEKNHEKENKVFVIKYKKHTGKPTVTHKDSMEEAICFGWIDTTVKRIDDERYGNYFHKRNRNSRWSKNTLGYAKRLINEGRMTPAGMRMYKQGLRKKPFDDGRPKVFHIPEDLKKALDKNKKARENFHDFAPSYRRTYLAWLWGAKLPETRKRRIQEIVERSKEKKRWGDP